MEWYLLYAIVHEVVNNDIRIPAFSSHDIVITGVSISQVLFDLLPRLCGVANDESISATDFRQASQRWGEGGGERVPLYCNNDVLHDAVKGGKGEVREEVTGDDTRSIAHQVG